MRHAMWTSYLCELGPEKMVEAFAERGWRYLELSDEHGHALLRRGDAGKTGEAFGAFARDHGVGILQGHYLLSKEGLPDDGTPPLGADTAPADDGEFEEMMEAMKRWVELFAAIGIEAGVYHHGGYELAKEGWSEERILARRREGIERVCGYARGTKTKVCVENLPKCSASWEAVERLVEGLAEDDVGVCLDTGHANMEGVECAGFVRSAGRRLAALHVHDSVGEWDHILPYGRGTVDWGAFMKTLREVGYEGLFNWEIPGETQRCPLEVLLLKLEYVRKLGEWMDAHEGR